MGQCKVEGYMVSHPVHYLITIQNIELHFWTDIICMVMHRITCLKDGRLDVLSTKYIQFPIIKMAATDNIEYHLGI